jgi:hypothetical protein
MPAALFCRKQTMYGFSSTKQSFVSCRPAPQVALQECSKLNIAPTDVQIDDFFDLSQLMGLVSASSIVLTQNTGDGRIPEQARQQRTAQRKHNVDLRMEKK